MATIMDIETVSLNEEENSLVILNQVKLPNEVEILHLNKLQDIWNAIKELQVRGAPAIGVAAAIGSYVVAKQIKATNFNNFYLQFKEAIEYLATSRPTAINLFWALNRMDKAASENKTKPLNEILNILRSECLQIREEDVWVCRMIGEYGLSLIADGDGILTHCNAGQLGSVKYGTALAPLHIGKDLGYNFNVFVDETRPLLQGARLTTFELQSHGIDTTLVCDNMASTLMRSGSIQAIFVGCDRVAANGDVANKIGTAGLAIIAKNYGVPFYVCAPTSTIDMEIKTGWDIPIEQRDPTEITEKWYEKRMAPQDINVFNPAFDITDSKFITAIISEYGIAKKPYKKSLKTIFAKKAAVAN